MSKRSHKVNQTNQALNGCPIYSYLRVWKISIRNYCNIYFIYSFERDYWTWTSFFKKMLKSTYDFDRSIINHAVHTSTYGTSDNKVFLLPKKTRQNKTRQINHTKTKLCDVIRSSQFMKPFQMLIMIMTLLKKCKKKTRSLQRRRRRSFLTNMNHKENLMIQCQAWSI